MAEAGELHPYLADTASAMAEYYDFEPQLVALTGQRKFYTGSNGYATPKANAVRIDVPFALANVEDFYHFIPNTTEEVCVLVTFDVTREKDMLSISRGNHDKRLAENMRQLSRIEGEVYLAFCPGVDSLRRTRTLHLSYKAAYIKIAEAARRYAPNVKLVYSISDTPIPGENTAGKFYPGDEYVDLFGVEVDSAFVPDPFASDEELCYSLRGEYTDAVHSVLRMVEYFRAATGRDCPVTVTGVSFPYGGRNGTADYRERMSEFYRDLPLYCGSLTSIFYNCNSSSLAMCNLRGNPDAAAAYEACLRKTVPVSVPLGELYVSAEDVSVTVATGGLFRRSDTAFRVNGEKCTTLPAITEDPLTLDVYSSGDYHTFRATYTVQAMPDGTVSARLVPPKYDYNGNGYYDFGDTDLLAAYISRWNVDLGDIPTDVNGDGKTNIFDVSSLQMMMWQG